MKVGTIIQARVSSTRLPVKVLRKLPYAGQLTVLENVIRRLKRSKETDEIIVATTASKEDDQLTRIARKEKVRYFRGSRDDVLSRYHLAAKEARLDVIARITSDCPCIDPKIVDTIIERHLVSNADYTSNTLERTYPRGLDVEVFNADGLEVAHKKAGRDY